MNVLIRSALLTTLACTGCGLHIVGSGTIQSETRVPSAAFTGIEIRDVIHATVTVGPAASIVLTGDDNVLPRVRTDVVGGHLVIALDPAVSYSSPHAIDATITVPSLGFVAAHDASQLVVTAIAGDALEVQLTDAAQATLSGATATLDLQAADAASADLDALPAGDAQVALSDAVHATVRATHAAGGTLRDAARLVLHGQPASQHFATSDTAQVDAE